MTVDDDPFDPLDERPGPRRDSKGRFPKGVSGNPRGRKMQFRQDPGLPASRRRVVSAVADEEIEVKVGGKTRRMTMFEANVRALAHAGIKDRVAAQRFIDLATDTSERDLQRRVATHMIREHYDRLEQENERLRELVPSRGGVVHVNFDRPLDEWSPAAAKAVLDDEYGVRAALTGNASADPGTDDSDAAVR